MMNVCVRASVHPGFQFRSQLLNPLFWFLYFHTSAHLKTSETKTTIDLDKISEEIVSNVQTSCLKSHSNFRLTHG